METAICRQQAHPLATAGRFPITTVSLRTAASLPRRLGRLDRLVQFMFGCPQVLFGLGAMPFHVVVIGGPGAIHLPHRFLHVATCGFQVCPVTNLFGNCDSAGFDANAPSSSGISTSAWSRRANHEPKRGSSARSSRPIAVQSFLVVVNDTIELHLSDLLEQRNRHIVFKADLLDITFLEK